jgi:hypothetical protein
MPAEFTAKWTHPNRTERQAAQEHLMFSAALS